MKRVAALLISLLALSLSACAVADEPVPLPDFTPIPPGDGDPDALAPGATLDFEGYRVQFLGVTEDSRCPLDVNCVWSGEAIVALSVTDPQGTSQELTISSLYGHETVEVSGLSITLLSVAPDPYSTQTIAPEDYRVRLDLSL